MLQLCLFCRFKDQGRDFCMSYTDRVPHSPYLVSSGTSPSDLIVENEDWGKGSATAFGINRNGTLTVTYLITFPGNEG